MSDETTEKRPRRGAGRRTRGHQLGQVRLPAERVRGARGRREHQRGGPPPGLADPGLRQDVAEDLPGADPGRARLATDLIATWKQRFPDFWPEGNRFYGPLTGIAPGEVALLNMTLPGQDEALDRRDGALRRRGVVHADDAAGPHVRRLDHVQRHGGRRRHRRPGAGADARQRPDLRAGADARRPQAGGPLLAAHADRRWRRTSATRPTWTPRSCASTRSASGRRWRNVWHSSAIRSTLYMLGAPGRALKRLFKRDRAVA